MAKQVYTFEELVAWKARSTEANEQKKIRRLIRQLREHDPHVPQLRRGISRHSGVFQPNIDTQKFNPGDKTTWPTTGFCSERGCGHSETLHGKFRCKATLRDTVVERNREVTRERDCDCTTFKPTYDVTVWTEDMHEAFIDWMATENPLHRDSYVNKDGVPMMGCDSACCATRNWPLYQSLLLEARMPPDKKPKKSKKKGKKFRSVASV